MTTLTLIVSTYNQPEFLKFVLNALYDQSDKDFELIIADDGSTRETLILINQFKEKLPLIHCWQTDKGFRKSKILNKAILISQGKILSFLDGDCVPRKHFIRDIKAVSRKNCVVGHSRVLLDQTISQHILDNDFKPHMWSWFKFIGLRISGHINRLLPLIPIPFGIPRNILPTTWKKIRGCNFSIDRSLAIKIGGFDESFTGWGFEDSDLAVRAQLANGYLKRGDFKATVLHLWHFDSDRNLTNSNYAKLKETIQKGRKIAIKGLKNSSSTSD